MFTPLHEQEVKPIPVPLQTETSETLAEQILQGASKAENVPDRLKERATEADFVIVHIDNLRPNSNRLYGFDGPDTAQQALVVAETPECVPTTMTSQTFEHHVKDLLPDVIAALTGLMDGPRVINPVMFPSGEMFHQADTGEFVIFTADSKLRTVWGISSSICINVQLSRTEYQNQIHVNDPPVWYFNIARDAGITCVYPKVNDRSHVIAPIDRIAQVRPPIVIISFPDIESAVAAQEAFMVKNSLQAIDIRKVTERRIRPMLFLREALYGVVGTVLAVAATPAFAILDKIGERQDRKAKNKAKGK